MQTRKLGFTDLRFTTIGLGAWAIGGKWEWGWGEQDDNQSITTIQRAIDLGINWIDTAPAYGYGHSEEIVGKAIAGRRDQVLIATKCSLTWDEGGSEIKNVLKAESIRREVEASLRRLNIDVIDLYQIHWPFPDEDIEEGWSTIADLVKEGKIRYGGVSNFSVEQIKRAQAIHPVASLQPPYSMLVRNAEDDLLGYCAENRIGVVVYSPMQAGLLTGKFSMARIASLDESDWRRRNKHFQEPEVSATFALVEKLRPIAERNGRTLAQLAIAWVLRRPEVTSAIVGARRPAQIEETAQAGDWVLADDDIDEIEKYLDEWKHAVESNTASA